MRLLITLIIVSLLWTSPHVNAQTNNSYEREIKEYTKNIDSIEQLDHPNNFGYSTLIEDGIIKRKKQIVAGYSITTLSKKDTVLKIEYRDNYNVIVYKTYYYKFNALIFAVLELENKKNSKNIFRKEEYYKNEVMISSNIVKNNHLEKYQSKIKLNLLLDGNKYLNEFKRRTNTNK